MRHFPSLKGPAGVLEKEHAKDIRTCTIAIATAVRWLKIPTAFCEYFIFHRPDRDSPFSKKGVIKMRRKLRTPH